MPAAPPPPSADDVARLAASAPRIVLGSGSASRRALLDELAAAAGLGGYEVVKADIDEKAIRLPDPRALVLALARAKADAVEAKLRAAVGGGGGQQLSGLLIACDQVVVHEGRVLEKPADEAEARAMIAGYARAPARTVGATLVRCLASGRAAEAVDEAEVHFREIPAAAVDALVAEGDVFWCAGALMVEHALVAPHVARLVGGQDAVMGLGKATLLRLLCEVGLPPRG